MAFYVIDERQNQFLQKGTISGRGKARVLNGERYEL